MPVVEVERTYLELRSPAELVRLSGTLREAPPLARVSSLGAAAYREMYRGVGANWHWRDRLTWTDARLRLHLSRPDVHVWVLGDSSNVDGFFELEQRPDRSVEIAHFGLHTRAMGRGLGRWMPVRAVED